MGKLSPEVTDEGAESDITAIGAHSSVAFRDTFPILGKAFARRFVCANRPINQNLKNKLTFCGVKVTFRSVEFSGLVAPENCRECGLGYGVAYLTKNDMAAHKLH